MWAEAALAMVLATSAPQDPDGDVVEDIIVEGVRRDEQASFDFVRTISAPPFGSNTMAVWTTPLCLKVENLRPEQAGALADRVLGRAEFVGVEIADAGCRPNVSVVFTADGAATASELVKTHRASFRPTTGATQLDRRSMADFANAERAVRWWTVNMPVDVESGQRVVALRGEHIPVSHNPFGITDALGNPAIMTGGPPWRKVWGMQPPGNNIQDALQLTVVVVDASLTSGLSLASLGDYLSMVVLTQVDPDAEIQTTPSILSLFSGNPTATEMSKWDLDYLSALYDTPVRWSHIRFQQQDIARRMVASAAERESE